MKYVIASCLLGASLLSSSAFAQTCASPVAWTPGQNGAPAYSGDLCTGGETGILSLCEQAQDAHGHAYVLRFTSSNAATYTTITINNTGFTAYMALVNTSVAGACNGGGDTGHCATTGDINTPIQHANVPPGDYYLIVSNSGADQNTACGPFTIDINGTPVMLQSFEVI